MVSRQFYVLLVLFSSIPFQTSAQAPTASYYSPPYTPSSCHGFTYEGVMIAAASEDIWDDGAACGRTYTIKCVGGTNQAVAVPCKEGKTVTVKIVDFCPSPDCKVTINLSQEAFRAIADTDEGIIQISYTSA